MSLANSVALQLAGVTAKTPGPLGGVIVRDAQGNPTGALKDAAQDLVNKVIPPLTHEQRVKAVKRALAHAASLGVTSVQNIDRKSTRLNSSHGSISYAVFCLK